MSDTVWISIAPGDGSNLRYLTNSFVRTEKQNDGMAWGERNNSGESLPAECFPEEIYGTPDAKESAYKLPDLFFEGNFWVVSKAAADVLRQFDLGGGGLYPVKVLKKDRETPVGGDWFCINFGNRKEALLVSESVPLREDYIRHGEKGWFLKAPLKDNDIAVSQEASSGPDLWIDPQMGDAIFFSDALGRALKSAKADKGFFLHACRVI
ncbi:imm11 family protein [Agrobacterium sp. 22-209-1]